MVTLSAQRMMSVASSSDYIYSNSDDSDDSGDGSGGDNAGSSTHTAEQQAQFEKVQHICYLLLCVYVPYKDKGPYDTVRTTNQG